MLRCIPKIKYLRGRQSIVLGLNILVPDYFINDNMFEGTYICVDDVIISTNTREENNTNSFTFLKVAHKCSMTLKMI